MLSEGEKKMRARIFITLSEYDTSALKNPHRRKRIGKMERKEEREKGENRVRDAAADSIVRMYMHVYMYTC